MGFARGSRGGLMLGQHIPSPRAQRTIKLRAEFLIYQANELSRAEQHRGVGRNHADIRAQAGAVGHQGELLSDWGRGAAE
jgi:hypothetical protein